MRGNGFGIESYGGVFSNISKPVMATKQSQRISALVFIPRNTFEIFIAVVTFLTLTVWIRIQSVMTVKS